VWSEKGDTLSVQRHWKSSELRPEEEDRHEHAHVAFTFAKAAGQLTSSIVAWRPGDENYVPANLRAVSMSPFHRCINPTTTPTMQEVNTCISEYEAIKGRVDKMRELQASGQKLPENFMELEQQMAASQGNRTQGNARFTGQSAVRVQQAPAAVEAAGKNAKCGCGSGKKFKRCCMK